MKRQHPVAILRYTSKNFYLLTIPLLRGLLIQNFDFYAWLKGAYFDIAIVLIIIGSAFLRWWFVRFEFSENSIIYSAGILARLKFEIPYSIISAVSTKRIFWLRPTKAVSVYIDSETRSVVNAKNDTDIYIICDIDTLDAVFKKIPQKYDNLKLKYEASTLNLLIFSVVFSSTLSGALFLGTLFIQGSKLIGEEVRDRFINAVTDITSFAEKFTTAVTPVAVGVSLIIIGGWLFSFAANLIRHINFTIKREGQNIFISNGFFSSWRYYINSQRINYVDIGQNLLMKIFKVMSVNVSCSGYGKAKNEIPVFIPITTKSNVLSSMQMLLPGFDVKNVQVKSKKQYIMRFIAMPIIMVFLFLLAGLMALYFFYEWSRVIIFLIIMLELPCIYMIIVKYVSFYTNGIGNSKSNMNLCYCRYFKFHNVIIPIERIAKVKISQNIFQQRNKSCDIIIYTKAEFKKSHKVKGLKLEEVYKILMEMGVNCND